jgi:hypothetical protein
MRSGFDRDRKGELTGPMKAMDARAIPAARRDGAELGRRT